MDLRTRSHGTTTTRTRSHRDQRHVLYDNSLASSYLTRSDSRAVLFRLWYKYVDTLTPRSEKRNAQLLFPFLLFFLPPRPRSTYPGEPRVAIARPRASVRARPRTLEVTALRRLRARVLVPRAADGARPHQHLGMTVPPRIRTRTHLDTGSRSRAPISAPRSGRATPRASTSPHYMGSRSRAPTEGPPGGRSSPRASTCPRPTGSRSRAPAAPRGCRQSPRPCTRSSHGQPFSCAHFRTSNLPWIAAFAIVCGPHGQSFARAHFKVSRWPPCAARPHVASSTDSRSRAPTSAPRGRRGTPRPCTCARPTGSRSRAPCKISSSPCPAAYAHVSSSNRKPFSRKHLQHLEAVVRRGELAKNGVDGHRARRCIRAETTCRSV